MYLVVLLNALFATTFVVAKIVLSYTKPIFLVGVSMAIGGLLQLVYMGIKNPKKCVIAMRDVGLFAQVSIFSIVFSYGLQFWGMQYMPVFKSCFLYNFGPFASYLIAAFLFKEKMKLKKWLGLLVGFIGIIPILISTSPAEQGQSIGMLISLPEIAVIASVVCYSYGWFIIRILVHDRHYSPLLVNGIAMFLGGIVTLISVPLIEGPIVIHEMLPFFYLLSGMILVEFLICNNLYAYLLDKYSETFVSFSTFSIPLFGALYSWFFLSEHITWHFFVSSLIVAAAIALFYSAEHEDKRL